MIFACSSSLERVGIDCFWYPQITLVRMPDAVRDVMNFCRSSKFLCHFTSDCGRSLVGVSNLGYSLDG